MGTGSEVNEKVVHKKGHKKSFSFSYTELRKSLLRPSPADPKNSLKRIGSKVKRIKIKRVRKEGGSLSATADPFRRLITAAVYSLDQPSQPFSDAHMAIRRAFEKLLTDLDSDDDDSHAKATYLANTFESIESLKKSSTGSYAWTGFTDKL